MRGLTVVLLGSLTACSNLPGDWMYDEPFNYINQDNLQLHWRDCRSQPTCSVDDLVDRF